MSNITVTDQTIQVSMDLPVQPPEGMLLMPDGLKRFQQTGGEWVVHPPTRNRIQQFHGTLQLTEEDRVCPHCGARMTIQDTRSITLKHVPHGTFQTRIVVERARLRCTNCRWCTTPQIPFQMEGHRITLHLEQYIEMLLAFGLTLKEIAGIAHVDRHIVKEIDKRNLWQRYVRDGKIIQPEEQAEVLGIDEFLLHKGHKYATLIMNMKTGAILWLAIGKKKQVVYDFIEHVGLEWMAGVEAICCDMNADFASAFKEKCPHLEIVFDHFHLVKNFNDKVVTEVRKDVERELKAEGNEEAAKSMKRTKYILLSNRSTLQKKDARAGTVLREENPLFRIPEVVSRGGREAKYDELLASNELLFKLDYAKEALAEAYRQTDRDSMQQILESLIAVCDETGNKHFEWFARLIEHHMDGITAHATHPYSSGKVEGTMNLIKTVRRRAYGLPDDTYFFLKLFDVSRNRSK